MNRCLSIVLLSVFLVAGCESVTEQNGPSEHESEPTAYIERIEQWREDREERLREPYGWLSLAGMAPVDSDRFDIGSGRDNDLVVDRGPELWGTIVSSDDRIEFVPGPEFSGTVNGDASGPTELVADGDDGPTNIESNAIRVHLIERASGMFVRVRDRESTPRRNFAGLDWYPVDPEWAIEAEFEEHPEGTVLEIADVTGEVAERANPGAAVFSVDGAEFRLEAVESAAGDQYWFILADRTSGRETYGLGRFLYADLPVDGTMTLDFNKAYNPPCAFNEHTTCPLPPPENRLDLRIEAGERSYPGEGPSGHEAPPES